MPLTAVIFNFMGGVRALEPTQVISIIPYIIQNPNLIGFILFVICFLPLLAYVVRKADKQADRQQDFFNRSMDDAKIREERLGDLVNNTLTKQTEALNNINNTMICMNQNLTDVKGRVETLEDHIGIERSLS
ncbi:hypothetical protein [Sporomusa acidovorans]|uniref:Chromosome partition protein Smc n=1 Tax=Sporomusa acidovorans (strain ATCC 49682 / DSM 3132 / Mol) TaxID=1123286 RepID=A0ABZ3J6B6_SPOA4|nr:hypothetical protein [Sporomusa acidovorans]OZC23828.1 hypothetical protein SPACI_04530 [Sporomusa acidovorans DSM 3132]SDF62379.1 hypothetical protein SAMN04488499_106333 [Sporomusa acidovorans]